MINKKAGSNIKLTLKASSTTSPYPISSLPCFIHNLSAHFNIRNIQYSDIPATKANRGGPTARPASEIAYGILRKPAGINGLLFVFTTVCTFVCTCLFLRL